MEVQTFASRLRCLQLSIRWMMPSIPREAMSLTSQNLERPVSAPLSSGRGVRRKTPFPHMGTVISMAMVVIGDHWARPETTDTGSHAHFVWVLSAIELAMAPMRGIKGLLRAYE